MAPVITNLNVQEVTVIQGQGASSRTIWNIELCLQNGNARGKTYTTRNLQTVSTRQACYKIFQSILFN